MKKLIISVLIFSFSLNSAFAQCDFAKDIKENQDGSYTYTRECHIEVGKRVKKLEIAEKTIDELDLSLSKEKERTDMWRETSFVLDEKFSKYEKTSKLNDIVHVALGVGLTVLAVWAAGQIHQ